MEHYQNAGCPKVFGQPQVADCHHTQPAILFLLPLIIQKIQTFKIPDSYSLFIHSIHIFWELMMCQSLMLLDGNKMMILTSGVLSSVGERVIKLSQKIKLASQM